MDKHVIKKNYVLVNITEELVRKKVKEMMKDFDMCQCDKCYLDVCAIILNDLKPHYVTTEIGMLLTELLATHYQYQTDLTVHVLEAMKQVKNSPHH